MIVLAGCRHWWTRESVLPLGGMERLWTENQTCWTESNSVYRFKCVFIQPYTSRIILSLSFPSTSKLAFPFYLLHFLDRVSKIMAFPILRVSECLICWLLQLHDNTRITRTVLTAWRSLCESWDYWTGSGGMSLCQWIPCVQTNLCFTSKLKVDWESLSSCQLLNVTVCNVWILFQNTALHLLLEGCWSCCIFLSPDSVARLPPLLLSAWTRMDMNNNIWMCSSQVYSNTSYGYWSLLCCTVITFSNAFCNICSWI